MSFQYSHIETYSRKGSAKGGNTVRWVLQEARRDEGACPHVIEPGEPELVYGVSLDELEAMHDELCTSVRYDVAGGKSRAVRVDQHTLFTVVCSYPVPMEEVRNNLDEQRRLQEWQERNIAWLRAEYGDDLKCVIMHDDEQYPHIHAYVLPDDLRCRSLHAGVSAKEAVMKAGPAEGEDSKAHNKRGDKEYRAAMSRWQDRYFEQVGLPSGLTRLGPGKRRLSREGWRAEQAAVKAVQIAQERTREIEGQKDAFVAKTKAEAAKYVEKTRAAVKAEADRLKTDALAKAEESKRMHSAAVAKERAAASLVKQAEDRARKTDQLNERAQKTYADAQKIMKNAQSEANRILSAAQAQVKKIASFGSGIRSFFSGLKVDKIRAEIQKEAADQIDRLDNQRRDAVVSMYQEQRKRQEAEKRASDSVSRERETRDRLVEATVKIENLTKPKRKASNVSVAGNEHNHSRGMKM